MRIKESEREREKKIKEKQININGILSREKRTKEMDEFKKKTETEIREGKNEITRFASGRIDAAKEK